MSVTCAVWRVNTGESASAIYQEGGMGGGEGQCAVLATEARGNVMEPEA